MANSKWDEAALLPDRLVWGDACAPLNADSSRRTLARRSSSIVYPEAEDVGKPKMFARQSFVVSGEEEEIAAAILQARQIGEECIGCAILDKRRARLDAVLLRHIAR